MDNPNGGWGWLRSPLVLSVYAPTALIAFSLGMLDPVLPLFATEFEVGYGLVGLALAGQSLGMVLADIPAGVVLRWLGIKAAMAWGLALVIVSTALLFWAPSIGVVIGLRFVSGAGFALYNLSRHAYLAAVLSVHRRGRGLSVFGGMVRLGQFAGPAVGGSMATLLGLRVPFLAMGLALLAAVALVLIFLVRPDSDGAIGGHVTVRGLAKVLHVHRGVLLTAGMGQILVQMVRGGRQAIVPLYGADVLGLDAQAIGFIQSASWALDMSLFLVAGWLMDRFGRKYAIVPSFVLQGLGMALIPFTVGFSSLLAATLVIGFGNGLSAGTMMTLGADFAPPASRGEFLGVWRFIGDLGSGGGPLVVGGVADLLALGPTAWVLAGVGAGAALMFALVVPETLNRRPVENPT